jgi:hypothetical protein
MTTIMKTKFTIAFAIRGMDMTYGIYNVNIWTSYVVTFDNYNYKCNYV